MTESKPRRLAERALVSDGVRSSPLHLRRDNNIATLAYRNHVTLIAST
jgi:hypothetical protein